MTEPVPPPWPPASKKLRGWRVVLMETTPGEMARKTSMLFCSSVATDGSAMPAMLAVGLVAVEGRGRLLQAAAPAVEAGDAGRRDEGRKKCDGEDLTCRDVIHGFTSLSSHKSPAEPISQLRCRRPRAALRTFVVDGPACLARETILLRSGARGFTRTQTTALKFRRRGEKVPAWRSMRL
jgi:hypothetical protein